VGPGSGGWCPVMSGPPHDIRQELSTKLMSNVPSYLLDRRQELSTKLMSNIPSCLGAIKGTPRRMEQNTKPSLSILRLPDSASTHLIDCVSDLRSV
jgi:hypothetical protein